MEAWEPAPWTKFVPLTVSVNAVVPTAELGLSEVSVGALTVKLLAVETAVEAPFWTVTLCAPSVTSSAGATGAVNWLELTYVVVSGELPQYTVDAWVPFVPLTKFVPFTVRVMVLPLPATAELGLSDVIVGPFTVNEMAFEAVAPDALMTVTFTAPDVASSVEVTAAVSEVGVLAVAGT